MMTATFFPMRGGHMKPAFWGVDRDLKDVLETIDQAWQGLPQTTSEFSETEQTYFLTLDLPGVNKSTIDIQVEGDKLLINGIRKHAMFEHKEAEQKVSRIFVLPKHADKDKIQAHCEDGVLYLAIPKVEKAKPKKIEINQGSKSAMKNMLSDALGKKETRSQIPES